MASTKYTPLSPSFNTPLFPNKRTNTSTSISTIDSSTSDSYSSANSSVASSPHPDTSTSDLEIAYAIKKRSLSKAVKAEETETVVGLYKCLEEANNTVYKMRLEYETCDPCFFWYGDGSSSGSFDQELEKEKNGDVGKNEKGDCLSWEVFADDEESHAGGGGEGCRVWVERVEVDIWGGVEISNSQRLGGEGVGKGSKREHNWREALEPIARPCEFWGTFLVKG